MPDEAIAVDDLTCTFGATRAVSDLRLRVPRGSVYAFLGPNGAGKSTTIRALLGLLRPDSGRIVVLGRALASDRLEILRRTGSLIEQPSLYPHLTGRENLEIARRLLSAPRSDIDRVLAIVGLQRRGTSLVRTYSLGMKQRLGLALALLGRRELLVLDEPTNGLDPQGMSEIRTLIRRLPDEAGITVFLSTHLLSEVEQVATHVGILSLGRLAFEGPLPELSTRRRRRLRIEVEPVDRAAALLEAHGWLVEVAGGALRTMQDADAAGINTMLVQAGCRVSHLAIESGSLEDVFLSMTTAEVH
jgi:ABC-2 type transport system ATP-binding protein